LDHPAPAAGLFRPDDDDVGVFGDDLLEYRLLDQKSASDGEPSAGEPPQPPLDGAFEVAA
jgi:hypothetical protein